jgi:hypothetical protein
MSGGYPKMGSSNARQSGVFIVAEISSESNRPHERLHIS